MIARKNLAPLWALLELLKRTKQKIALDAACRINKNFRFLAEEIKDIQEVEKKLRDSYPPEYFEFEKKRIELCKEYADKDEKGEPQTYTDEFGGKFLIKEKFAEFDQALTELRLSYKETLDKKEEIDQEFSEFINAETEIELLKIKSEDLKNVDFTIDEAES